MKKQVTPGETPAQITVSMIDQDLKDGVSKTDMAVKYGIKAWEERNWIGQIIKINNVSFKVEKNIPRCVAINLKPKTDDNSLNLLQSLKKTYNHFDMGIYLTSLDDGKIEIGNSVEINK